MVTRDSRITIKKPSEQERVEIRNLVKPLLVNQQLCCRPHLVPYHGDPISSCPTYQTKRSPPIGTCRAPNGTTYKNVLTLQRQIAIRTFRSQHTATMGNPDDVPPSTSPPSSPPEKHVRRSYAKDPDWTPGRQPRRYKTRRTTRRVQTMAEVQPVTEREVMLALRERL